MFADTGILYPFLCEATVCNPLIIIDDLMDYMATVKNFNKWAEPAKVHPTNSLKPKVASLKANDSVNPTNSLKANDSVNPDRKSTRLNSSHVSESRMPSSA